MFGRIHNMYLLVTALFLFLSCAKPVEIIIPDDPVYPTSGTATVDNKSVSYPYDGSGFFFSTARIIYYPNTSGVFPDIPVKVAQGFVYTPYFWSIDGNSAFKLLNSSLDSSTASAFFDSLAAVSDTSGFLSLTSNVSVYQTIAIRAHQGKYAKILITEVMVDTASSTTEVTFKWVYQPDGTTTFLIQ